MEYDMSVIALWVICCSVIGAVCEVISEKSAAFLLKKRGRKLIMSAKEITILTIITACFGGAAGYYFHNISMTVFFIILMCLGTTVAITDWHERLIPNELWESIIVLKVVYLILSYIDIKGVPDANIMQSLLGGIVCFVIFSAPALFGKSVGMGDIKLAMSMGFALGLYSSMAAIVIMGGLVLIYTIVQNNMPVVKMIKEVVPMGPFISAGMLLSLLAAGGFI